MERLIRAAVIILLGCACALDAQSTKTRRILFDTFIPIAARLQPGDQHLTVVHVNPMPLVAYPDEDFVTRLVRKNPIIFTGRIVEKQPVFLRHVAGKKDVEVSATEANWIGSRVTMLVDGLVQTTDELPLTLLRRLTWVEDGDGTTTINGVRIDTETPWLEPLQQGRRYLVSGRILDGTFSSTGLWMEPADGGIMKPRLRDSSPDKPKRPFDDWTISQATDSLNAEAQRQRVRR